MGRKHPYKRVHAEYTPAGRAGVHERRTELRERYGLTDLEARVFEVITRYEGENGLSRIQVNYLANCVLDAIEEKE
jgi:hypothetical protein